MNKFTGAICILAYPEEFVSMIPAWYRKPMEWTGMVNDGVISAGHSAMALINKESGEIFYADFGRYITKMGLGRTRMKFTDPDVDFSYRVAFDDKGEIIDKHRLFQEFYNHPEKTHGGPIMYVSLNQQVNFQACYDFITNMNSKGSIKYDPFGKGRSNCSRFVFDAILAGVGIKKQKIKLKLRSPITSSPLGNVFHGTEEETYKYSPEGSEVVTNKSLVFVCKHLFRKPSQDLVRKFRSKKQIQISISNENQVDFLEGLGDQAFIELVALTNSIMKINKHDGNGIRTFTNEYRIPENFDPNLSFEFIHDCNAAWLTVKQGENIIRLDSI